MSEWDGHAGLDVEGKRRVLGLQASQLDPVAKSRVVQAALPPFLKKLCSPRNKCFQSQPRPFLLPEKEAPGWAGGVVMVLGFAGVKFRARRSALMLRKYPAQLAEPCC